ncbi:hypothetical protein DES53_109133 [Roseimicrobium gellanilyticum]|uniref:DUF4190 domain-containing protein n=1 Tax=Roseimicrobium gellanilyticum TaxID=748857 RepID=A0A366HBM0_9BACT|nr:DUF4190 domain-containing protein [Roseimicrobium gellanilyticum]RBP39706.1 hypothetical protein DES53_109133 [Roseimicrobium gellanilyticum]
MKPHRGTLILVFGILGLVTCQIFGIVAWIMGNNDLREMDAGIMDPEGRSNTSAGRICGMISAILLAVSLLIILVVVMFIGVAGVAASAGQ